MNVNIIMFVSRFIFSNTTISTALSETRAPRKFGTNIAGCYDLHVWVSKYILNTGENYRKW